MNTDTLLTLKPIDRALGSVASCAAFSPEAGPVWVARAPGRLDVIGGIADYSGSLVCELPLEVAAAAVGQGRCDNALVCISRQSGDQVRVPVDALHTRQPEDVARLCDGPKHWARYPIGCIWWLMQRGGKLPLGKPVISGGDFAFIARKFSDKPGLTILIDSDVPLGGGVSSSAAIEVATMTMAAKAMDVELSPMALAAACQQVENRVVGAPCGVMDQVTSCMGQENQLLELLCQPDAHGLPARVIGQVPIPDGIKFIGIHSGVSHEVSGDPYTDTRVASFMGQKILSTLEDHDLTAGHLANVDRGTFRRELVRRLPQVITGQAFIDTFGRTHDTVTTIKPDKTYHVRHAASHGVLENDRVHRFVKRLREAADVRGVSPLIRAGRLMYASHYSYTYRANLGHEMTDRLVRMVRSLGPDQGFFGAKITGGGCGGTVAIMIRDDARVHEKVNSLRDQYTRETGRPTRLFDRTSPGAASLGVVSLTFDQVRAIGAS